MKKSIKLTILSVMLLTMVYSISFAQTEKVNPNRQKESRTQTNKQTDSDAIWLRDGYMVKDEKVMVIKNGKVTTLDKEVVLKNGDKIMPNAVLVKKDGEKRMLKAGDYLDTEGQLKTRQAMTKDCMMMKDGKMYISKDGKTTIMEKDMTMRNGTICSADGKCTTRDGKRIILKEGECMDMEGHMMDKENRMMNK